jgi:integrase/recombinase XerD
MAPREVGPRPDLSPAGRASLPQVVSPWERAVREWAASLDGQTRQAYIAAVRRAGPEALSLALTPERAREILERLRRTWAPATVAATVAAVRSCWRALVAAGLADSSPWSEVRPPRVKDRTGERILSADELRRMWQAARTQSEREWLRFLVGTGLRVSEACGVRWRDVRVDDRGRVLATIQGKGGKTRTIRIPSPTYDYLRRARGGMVEPEARLWGFSRRTGHRIVRRLAVSAGLDRLPSPHWMRHTHATMALTRGVPLHTLQASLGHARLETTQRYLHADPSQTSGDWF